MSQNPNQTTGSLRAGTVVLVLAASMIFMTRAIAAVPSAPAEGLETGAERTEAGTYQPDRLIGGFWRPAGSNAQRPALKLSGSVWQPAG